MKKSNQIYFFFIIIIVSIFGYLSFARKDTTNSKVATPTSPQITQATIPEDTDAESEYLAYNAEDFEKNKSKRRVLFFYANWCTTCRPVNAQFLKEANQIPEDVVVYRVNYKDSDTDDQEKALADKYKITYQHTFVQVNEQGNEIKKWNGGNLADLIKNVN